MLSADALKQQVRDRLAQLEAAIQEQHQLKTLLELLPPTVSRRNHDGDGARGAKPTTKDGSSRAKSPRPARRAGAKPAGASGTQRMPLSARKDQIAHLVAQRPTIDAKSIAEATGLSRPRVSQLTTALITEDRLERSQGGYLVTAKKS